MNLDIYADKTAPPERRKRAPTGKKPFHALTQKELAALPRDEYIANLSPWLRAAVRKSWDAAERAKKLKR